MEQPIQYNEIIDLDGLSAKLKKISEEDIPNFAKAMKDSVTSLNPALKEDQQQLLVVSDSINKMGAAQKEFNIISERSRLEEQARRREITLTAKVNMEHTDSLARMRAELALNTFEATKSKEAYQRLQPEIAALTSKIKEQEEAMGSHQRNVGNYKSIWDGVVESLTKVGLAMISVQGIIKGLQWVWKEFSSANQNAIDHWRLVANETGMAWDVLKGRIVGALDEVGAKVGEKGPLRKAMDLIVSAPIMILEKLGFKKFVGDLNAASSAAEQITKKQIEFEKEENDLIIARSEATLKLKEAKELAATSDDPKEKIKAIQDALKFQKQIEDIDLDHAQHQITIIRMVKEEHEKNGLGTEKEVGELTTSVARKNAIESEYVSERIRLEKTLKKEIDAINKSSQKQDALDAKFEGELQSDLDDHKGKSAEVDADNEKALTELIVKNNAELTKDAEKTAKEGNKIADEESNYEYNAWKKRWDDKEKLKQEEIKSAKAILNSVDQLANELFSNDIARIEDKANADITAANGNAAAIAAIKKKEAKDVAKIQREQFIFQQAMSALQVGISTAEAVMKAAPNPVLIALTSVLGAVELAVVLAKKPPAAPTFEHGGYGLLDFEGGVLAGRRHSQGGVDLGEIGEGEQGEYFGIINRNMTQRYRDLLPSIFSSLNSGQFENIWDRTNQQLSSVLITNNNEQILHDIHNTLKDQRNVHKLDDGRIMIIEKGKISFLRM